MKMKISLLCISLFCLGNFAWANDSLPAPGKFTVGSGIKGNVFLDGSYEFNFNLPPQTASPITNSQNQYRVYDRAHHQFQLNQATVGFYHDADPVGFDVAIGAGNQMDLLNSDNGTVERTFSNVRRASINWAKNKWSLDLGRFDAEAGFERIDSVDNWNYSRSWQFSSQPKMYNGLRAGYMFNSEWSATATVANAADRNNDTNRSKTYEVHVAYDNNKTSWWATYEGGSEKAFGLGEQWRHTFTTGLKHAFSNERCWAGLEGTVINGLDEQVGATPSISKDAARYGVSGYWSHMFWSENWDTLRVEWFDDKEGALTFMNTKTYFLSATLTHRYKLSPNMSFWFEFRWDHANHDAFTGKDGLTDRSNQATALVAATFNI